MELGRILKGAAKRARHAMQKHEETVYGWLFLGPALTHFIAFMAFPFAFSLYMSLHKWTLLTQERPFIGLENYRRLLTDPTFIQSMQNTFYYVGAVTILTVVGSLALALLLNEKLRGVAWLRAAYYSPSVVSFIAVSAVWMWIFDPYYGLLNYYLNKLSLPALPWLSEPRWAMPALVVLGTWKALGYYAVVYLAGLQGIPDTYYEAARIDGAGWLACLRHVTWPLLLPYTFFILTMSIINAAQIFGPVYVMTQGGPMGSTSVIVYYLYQQAFEFYRMGYASAIGYVLFGIVFVLTLVQYRVFGRFSHA